MEPWQTTEGFIFFRPNGTPAWVALRDAEESDDGETVTIRVQHWDDGGIEDREFPKGTVWGHLA